jgi:deoxyadenosine/deoxycytidine kinase
MSVKRGLSAGKSTLLRLLAEELDFVVVPEPLNKWQCVGESPPQSIASLEDVC